MRAKVNGEHNILFSSWNIYIYTYMCVCVCVCVCVGVYV